MSRQSNTTLAKPANDLGLWSKHDRDEANACARFPISRLIPLHDQEGGEIYCVPETIEARDRCLSLQSISG